MSKNESLKIKGINISKNSILLTRDVLENGIKYKKDDGLMVGGHKYMGTYMEKTKVKPSALKRI